MKITPRKKHEIYRALLFIGALLLSIVAFYAQNGLNEYTSLLLEQPDSRANAEYPYKYAMPITVMAYIASFIDLFFKDFD